MTSSFSDSGGGQGRGSVVRRYQYLPTQAMVCPLEEDLAASRSNDAIITSADSPERAAAVLAAERRQIDELRQAALADAQQVCREAREQGYADGFQTGLADGQAQAEAKTAADVARMHQIVDTLVAERQRLLGETEADLVGLALAISQKVIGDLANSCSAVILHLAARAVDVLGDPDAYEVHVSPQDYDMLDRALSESGVARTWSLVADEHVTPGGCTVRHGAAQVDAQPQAQLALVHKAFGELTTAPRVAELGEARDLTGPDMPGLEGLGIEGEPA